MQNMIYRLRSYQNGVHGQFFIDVAAELERLAANTPCPCSNLSNAQNEVEALKGQATRTIAVLDGLEKIYQDEFQSLAEKSDKTDTAAFKYIYANQAIGVDKALKILQGARELAHI